MPRPRAFWKARDRWCRVWCWTEPTRSTSWCRLVSHMYHYADCLCLTVATGGPCARTALVAANAVSISHLPSQRCCWYSRLIWGFVRILTRFAGRRIYHTNVVLSVGSRLAVFCAEAVSDEAERKTVIASLSAHRALLLISLGQLSNFCGGVSSAFHFV
jgi:hypothetical protein